MCNKGITDTNCLTIVVYNITHQEKWYTRGNCEINSAGSYSLRVKR